MTTHRIAILAGDGIGPEIMREALKVLRLVEERTGVRFDLTETPFGAQAYFDHGHPFPEATQAVCDTADAILKGPVGLSYEATKQIPVDLQPERGAVLPLRARYNTYANFRPVVLPRSLAHFSPLRAEIIGALFNGVFLVAMAGWGFWMGAMRLADPMELPTGVMLWTAAGGIVTELIAFWLLYERQKKNLNLKGAFWHILQTFVGSLIIIVSAVVIRLTGFLEIDPLLGMAFGVALLLASWNILRSSLRVLLQSTPEGFDMERALSELQGINGVRDVHHPHAWSLTSGRNLFSAHIRVRDYAEDGERVLAEATDHLKRHYSVYFSTIQVEEDCLTEEESATAIDVTEEATPSGRNRGHAVHSSSPGSAARRPEVPDARAGRQEE